MPNPSPVVTTRTLTLMLMMIVRSRLAGALRALGARAALAGVGVGATETEMKKHLADYYACISNLDHELARVFDAQRRLSRGRLGLALGQSKLRPNSQLGTQELGALTLRVRGHGLWRAGRDDLPP